MLTRIIQDRVPKAGEGVINFMIDYFVAHAPRNDWA